MHTYTYVNHVTYVCYYKSGVFILRFTDRIGDDGAMESSFAQQEFEEMRRYVCTYTHMKQEFMHIPNLISERQLNQLQFLYKMLCSSLPIHVFIDCIDYM